MFSAQTSIRNKLEWRTDAFSGSVFGKELQSFFEETPLAPPFSCFVLNEPPRPALLNGMAPEANHPCVSQDKNSEES